MGKIVNIITFVIFLVAFAMCVIGYGSPWWAEFSGASYGLFQYCAKNLDGDWQCEKLDTSVWTAEHKATLAMMTIGVAGNLATMALFCMSLCKDMTVKAAAGASIATGVVVLIAVIIFGADANDVEYLDWSFWLAAIGGAGHIANAIITFILDCLSCC